MRLPKTPPPISAEDGRRLFPRVFLEKGGLLASLLGEPSDYLIEGVDQTETPRAVTPHPVRM